MNIVAVTDDRYAQHLGVMITSLLENASTPDRVVIYVLTGGLASDNEKKLNEITNRYRANLKILTLDATLFESFGTRNRMSHAAYYKLAIPLIVPEEVDKVIFLDCDLIIKEDIRYLWDTDVSNVSHAAVEEPFFNRHEQLGFPSSQIGIFNSGVMVINVAWWRQNCVFERTMAFLQENSHRIVLHDQDALNAVLYSDWARIHPKWNQFATIVYLRAEEIPGDTEAWETALRNPGIIHYSSSKPWYFLNDHPFKREYFQFLQKTPWADFVPLEQEQAITLLNKPTIVVYGTGSSGLRVHRILTEHGANISYFVDGDSSKWGMSYCDREVRSPEHLRQEEMGQLAVFVASYSYYPEMAQNLQSMGLVEGEHFIAGFGRR
ncbi:glycosyltransferase family 8 protein [Cohnella hongkongensis]|uniref:Glycosyltransferase family 8 protein n=1 Tax=Cohnella hongkongensis TaxID=178337 RepID=A0ABV9FEN2_9BACL